MSTCLRNRLSCSSFSTCFFFAVAFAMSSVLSSVPAGAEPDAPPAPQHLLARPTSTCEWSARVGGREVSVDRAACPPVEKGGFEPPEDPLPRRPRVQGQVHVPNAFPKNRRSPRPAHRGSDGVSRAAY